MVATTTEAHRMASFTSRSRDRSVGSPSGTGLRQSAGPSAPLTRESPPLPNNGGRWALCQHAHPIGTWYPQAWFTCHHCAPRLRRLPGLWHLDNGTGKLMPPGSTAPQKPLKRIWSVRPLISRISRWMFASPHRRVVLTEEQEDDKEEVGHQTQVEPAGFPVTKEVMTMTEEAFVAEKDVVQYRSDLIDLKEKLMDTEKKSVAAENWRRCQQLKTADLKMAAKISEAAHIKLKEEICQVRSTLQAKEKENDVLTAQLCDERQEAKKYSDGVADQISMDKVLLADLRAQLISANSEVSQLNDLLKGQTEKSTLTANNYRDDAARLKSENEELRMKIELHKQEVAQLSAQLIDERNKVNHQAKEITSITTEVLLLSAENAQLLIDNVGLQEQIQALQNESVAQKNTIRRLQLSVESTDYDNASLRRRIDAAWRDLHLTKNELKVARDLASEDPHIHCEIKGCRKRAASNEDVGPSRKTRRRENGSSSPAPFMPFVIASPSPPDRSPPPPRPFPYGAATALRVGPTWHRTSRRALQLMAVGNPAGIPLQVISGLGGGMDREEFLDHIVVLRDTILNQLLEATEISDFSDRLSRWATSLRALIRRTEGTLNPVDVSKVRKLMVAIRNFFRR